MENIIPIHKQGLVCTLETKELIVLLERTIMALQFLAKLYIDEDYSQQIKMYENTLKSIK